MVIVWNGSQGISAGDWNDPGSWQGGSAPQSNDEVLLPDYYGGYTVTISAAMAGQPLVLEADASPADRITLAVSGGQTFAPYGLGQSGAGFAIQLSQASTFSFYDVQGLVDPLSTAVFNPPGVTFADGSASEFIAGGAGFASLGSPLIPDFYTGTISGFGGRNLIQVAPISASSFFAYAPDTKGGTLTVYQPGLDPYYQTGGLVLYTEPAAVLTFAGNYRQDDFRLGYGANGVGLISAVAQTPPAAGPNVVRGTSGNDNLSAVGRFKSIYGEGGNDQLSLNGDNGQVLIGDTTTGVDRVTLAGTHDFVQGSAGNVAVHGGTGSNTYILGDGATASARYTITAGGAYNKFVLDDHATNTVVAGGQGASVAIGDAGDGATGTAKVTLAGVDNVVNVGDGNATVTGGTGYSLVDLGAGTDQVSLGGQNNRIMVGDGTASLHPGSGNDIVTLSGTDGHVTFAGSGNMLFLGAGASGTIDGNLAGLHITITGPIGDVDILGMQVWQHVCIANSSGQSLVTTADGTGGTILSLSSSADLVHVPGAVQS